MPDPILQALASSRERKAALARLVAEGPRRDDDEGIECLLTPEEVDLITTLRAAREQREKLGPV
jgi:hypothetical protein